MTVGTRTYKGLAVPLFGESELKQDTAATDFLTLTGDASISGDYLVMRTGATEVFVINSAGEFEKEVDAAAGIVVATSQYLKFSTPITTTVPTTGLDKGDMFLVIKSSTPQLAVCTDSTNNTLMYFTANTSTYGRASTT